MRRAFAVGLAVALGLAPRPAAAVDAAAVDAAVKKGTDWLRARQQADGSWGGKYADAYGNEGPTALAALALLKAGAKPNDPALLKAFNYLYGRPAKKTYCVSLLVLAIEARYAPDPKEVQESGEDYDDAARARAKKLMTPQDKQALADAIRFLLAQRRGGLWAYPGWGDQDLSNAQFAVLALAGARRLGVKAEPALWKAVADQMLEAQEATGPDVPPFPVPAADHSFAEIRKNKGFLPPGGGTRERDERKMRARGWTYKPKTGTAYGSMTAAGALCLAVAKSELEGQPGYDKAYGPRVDQAIRDGAAWVASRFRVDENPGTGKAWLYYWLYTLERLGDAVGAPAFGKSDWYDLGAQFIVKQQQGDGKWDVPDHEQRGGDIVDTAFAILFLTRATVPLVRERPTTGESAAPKGPTMRPLGDGRYEVTFTYRAAVGSPSRVSLAGSWNGWDKEKLAMERAGSTWVATVELPAGKHAYKFVVDGSFWMPDPGNPKSEDDGVGGKNSVLELP